MATVDRAATRRGPRPERTSEGWGGPSSVHLRAAARVAESVAGPAAIVGAVLVAMRGFLGPTLSQQHPDLLTMWIPTFTYLGRAVAQFHVPDWNPYAFGGMPFASDPQSGWLYLPPMLFFSLLPPNVALNALLLLNPTLAGLGAYAFLRSERHGRAAATVAGLFAAVPLATSRLALSTPLVGALGWTSIMLAAASATMRQRRPSRFVMWTLITAFCWGQVANAHLSNGLVIASGLLALYLTAVATSEQAAIRAWSPWRRAGALVAALPIVNAAVLLPRLRYLGTSSISLGYGTLQSLSERFTGAPTVSAVGLTSTEAGVSLASLPAPYLGLLGFALSLAWVSRRDRRLGLAFLAAASLFTLFASDAFAEGVQPFVGGGSVGGFLTHEPFRFLLGELLVLALLAGLGTSALIEGVGERGAGALLVLAPGAALWGLSALGQGSRFELSWLGLLAAVAVGVAILVAPRRVPVILVALVAYDLLSAGALGGRTRFAADPFPLRSPTVDADAFLAVTEPEGLVADAARVGDRFAPWAAWGDSGYGPFGYQAPEAWGIGGNGRGMVFGGMDVGGYNPSQPARTWLAMRRLDPAPKRYNQSFVVDPSPTLIDLLHLRWVIADRPPSWAEPDPVVTEGAWGVYAVPGARALATFPSSVERVSDLDAALERVASDGFDPAVSAVWEGDAAIEAGQGTATARWQRDDRLMLEVSASRGGLLLVRIPWDAGWRASLDGQSLLPIVAADGFLTGVVVPTGTHRVVLDYEDRAIAFGGAASLLAICALIGLAWIWRGREIFEVTQRTAMTLAPSRAERRRTERRRRRRR